MPGNGPNVSLASLYSILVRQFFGVRSSYCYPCFTDGDAEAQRLSSLLKGPQRVTCRAAIGRRTVRPEFVLLNTLCPRISCLGWTGSPHHSFSFVLYAEVPRDFTILLVSVSTRQVLPSPSVHLRGVSLGP